MQFDQGFGSRFVQRGQLFTYHTVVDHIAQEQVGKGVLQIGQANPEPVSEAILQIHFDDLIQHLGQHFDAELHTQHRGRVKTFLHAFAEAVDAAVDHVADAEIESFAEFMAELRAVLQEAFLPEIHGDLFHEKRISIGTEIDQLQDILGQLCYLKNLFQKALGI